MDRFDASLILFNRLGFALKEEYVNDKKIKEALEYVADEFKRCDKLEKALDNACDMLEAYDLANNELTRPKQSKEEWKAWALKDE